LIHSTSLRDIFPSSLKKVTKQKPNCTLADNDISKKEKH
jgi:hypothetical protein